MTNLARASRWSDMVLLGYAMCALAIAWPARAVDAGIVDSKYVIGRLPGVVFDWVDNSRFVFVGSPQDERDAVSDNSPAVRIWNTNTNLVVPYKNIRNACFKGDKIRYVEESPAANSTGKYVWWEGPLGNEVRHEKEKGSQQQAAHQSRRRAINPFHCEDVYLDELRPPLPDRSREIIALRDGDGYLAVEIRDAALLRSLAKEHPGQLYSVVWYHTSAPEGLRLPIELRVGGFYAPRVIGYSKFGKGYVIPGNQDDVLGLSYREAVARRIPHRLFLLKPSSRNAEVVDIPRVVTGVGSAMPTAAGWVFAGSGPSAKKEYGLYKYDGERVTLVERGLVSSIAVSQDGCKVVYAINTTYLEMGSGFLLKMIRLCGE